jgi:hypothetical protein
VAQTCLQGMFLIFLKGWGLDFSSSSPQTVPIKFFLFPSIFHQNPFVLIKFPNNSHQIPFVPIKFSSNSFLFPSSFHQIPFCSHQVSIKFLLFPYLWRIGRWAQVSTKVNGDTRERLGRSAKRSAAVRGQAGRGATVAGRRLSGAAEQKVGIFCVPGFVEHRGQICFSLGSLPRFFLHVRDPRCWCCDGGRLTRGITSKGWRD